MLRHVQPRRAFHTESARVMVLVLENKVVVSVLNPETKEVLKDEVIEVESGKKVEVDSAHLPNENYPLQTRLLTKEDVSKDFIERNLDQEDLKKEKVREIFEKIERPLPSVRPSLKFKDFVVEKETSPEESKEPEATISESSREVIKPIPTPTIDSRLTTTPKPTTTPSTANSISPSPARILR